MVVINWMIPGRDKPSMANDVVFKPEPRLKEMEDTGKNTGFPSGYSPVN